ncbi:MAG: hypothetical protein ACI8RZ_005306 [Myxococcota bacterium]|jgi:hypothetical protein
MANHTEVPMRAIIILLSFTACNGSKDADTADADTNSDLDTADLDTADTDADTDTTDTDADQTPSNLDSPRADCTMLVEHDNDGNGSPDVALNYQYDSRGLLSWVEQDSGANGGYDIRYEYTYDDAGLLVAYAQDVDLNGIDYSVAYTRDGDGDIVHVDIDSDGSGDIDQVIDWVYDDDKLLLREESDDGSDGSIDDLYTHLWIENDDGTMTDERSSDFGNDSEIDMVTHKRFNMEGKTLDIWDDIDADALWDQHKGYTYNDAGNTDVYVIEFLADDGTTVEASYTWEYTHDEWGRTDYVDVHTVNSSVDFWALQEYTYSCE